MNEYNLEEEMKQYRAIVNKWDASVVHVALIMELLMVARFSPNHETANALRALAELLDSKIGKDV